MEEIIINILHVISGDDNGGAGNHVINICIKENKLFNNEIAFLGSGILLEKAKDKNIKCEIFNKSIKNTPLIEYINKNNCDLAVFHGARTSLIHLIYKNKINKKTATTIHSDFRYDFLNNKIKQIIFTPLSIMGLRTFKNYICVSNNLKDVVKQQKLKGKTYVVNNAIDVNSIKSRETLDEIRNKFNLDSSQFVFGCVGRFHPIKNHLNVIEGFKKFNNEHPNTNLLLIGDGPLRKEIENKISELRLENKVHITNFVNNPTDYLRICDCSIIASFSEGGAPPLVMLESAYVKVPVMATKVGDMENILTKDIGFIIEDQSSNAIYSNMKKAYEDNNIKLKGINSERLLSSNFTIDKFWKNYFKIYGEIINN